MKILLVEKNHTLANIIALKIQQYLGYDVDIAYSFKDVKDLLKLNYYPLAIVDLQVQDNSYEIINYIHKREIFSIIMSSSSKEIEHQKLENKNIVNYILKNRSESIDYMISSIYRVMKNREISILVVDNKQNSSKIKKILNSQLLNVITIDNCIDAINYIRKDKNIKLVIVNYNLPKSESAIELVIAIRMAYKKDELPIFGLINDDIASSLFLKYGVNDFIKNPILKDALTTRVNNILDAQENINKLKNFANTDYMTQISNRKHFYNVIGQYYKYSKMKKIPFAIAMLDIDYFKYVNDSYGHTTGDLVIKKVAEIIKDNIKGQDLVARFGGEEFCIALKDIDKYSAYYFLDSLREKISSARFNVGEGISISFTVSIGISTNYGNSLDDMIKESDKYLYKAKDIGRNRVCSDINIKSRSRILA